MVYPIGKYIIPQIIKLWIRKVNGLDNIPKKEAFIAACNHTSFFEDFAIPSIIINHLNKKLHIYTNSRFFKNIFLRKFLYWGGCIPVEVDQKSSDRNKKAFKEAMAYIKNKELFGIFPEGHRSIDGKLKKAKTGVARLALSGKIPVVPFGVIGAYDILPKGKMVLRFKRCTVNIGKPIYFDKYYGKEDNPEVLREVTDKIMKEIAKLSNQKYEF